MRLGIVSILLALAAFLFTGGGLLAVIVPVLGAIIAFAAPALALAAIVTGGVAMSRASRNRENNGTGLAGLILGMLAFVPAMFVATTCGLCNALFSAGDFQDRSRFDFQFDTSNWQQNLPPGMVPDDDAGMPSGRPDAPSPAFEPPPLPDEKPDAGAR